MTRRLSSLSAFVGIVATVLFSVAAGAQSATRVYIGSSAAKTAAAESQISVPIRLDAAGAPVNAVDVVLTFPAQQLSFVGLDKAGGYFDTLIPAQPSASQGKLEFSAAKLKGTTSDDVLIANAVFLVRASSGTAQIDLTGSQAANAGAPVESMAGSVTVAFTGAQTGVSQPNITNIAVPNITATGGTIQWHTNVPTSSSVDYGLTARYGFTSGSTELVTDHRIELPQVFSGKVTVHYRVSSAAAEGQSSTSADQAFTTKGYTVVITVLDKQKQPLANTPVRVGGASAVQTNDQGKATVSDVAPGNQKVVIGHEKAQFIAVKATRAAKAADAQTFTLTAHVQHVGTWLVVLGLLVVALLGAAAWWRRDRSARSAA